MKTYDPDKVEALIKAVEDHLRQMVVHKPSLSSAFYDLKAPQEPEMEHVMPEWEEFKLNKPSRSSFPHDCESEVLVTDHYWICACQYNALREATRRPKQTQGKLPDNLSKDDFSFFSEILFSPKEETPKQAERRIGEAFLTHLKKKYNV